MKKIILASAMVLSVATFAMASGSAVVPNLDKGTNSLRLNGSYDANHPLDYQLTLEVGYGYFFWDNIELAVLGGWQSNTLIDTIELGVVGEYNFKTNTPWVPFLLVGVLYAGAEVDDDVYNDSDDMDADTWIGRFGGGIKYFFREDIAVDLAVNYDVAADDIYWDDDGNADGYNWTMQLGLRYYFD